MVSLFLYHQQYLESGSRNTDTRIQARTEHPKYVPAKVYSWFSSVIFPVSPSSVSGQKLIPHSEISVRVELSSSRFRTENMTNYIDQDLHLNNENIYYRIRLWISLSNLEFYIPRELIRFPQTDELWKKRKKIPKNLTMIASTSTEVSLAYLSPIWIIRRMYNMHIYIFRWKIIWLNLIVCFQIFSPVSNKYIWHSTSEQRLFQRKLLLG